MHIRRVATVYEPEIDVLPRDLRSVLTDQDVAAICGGPEYFDTLASSNSPDWLRELLKRCAESVCELQFHASGNAPYRPYFRFYWGGEPFVSLPRAKPLRTDLPAFLRQLYGIIGAFRENGFDMAGGLHAGDELKPVCETGMWVEPDGPIDLAEAIPFLETLSGSQLCYLSEGGVAWLESCQFRPVKELEHEVARYFEALLEGTRI
jgi:hypothetical protein